MCGIAGWMDSGGIDPAVLDRALATLNRRGPDGSGTWTSPDRRVILGHRRLAILDPSFRGEEPSFSPDGQSAFVHNGEIYNFRSLRECLESRGETFVSESDGEVAHRLLRQDGPDALGRIEGMFARALWNGTERTLLLARDRIGIKPLYYAVIPGGFAFASEPKALLQLPGVPARLEPDALSDFLSYGYVPFDRCLFTGIRKLPPAHRLTYDAVSGRIEVTRFWRLEPSEIRDEVEELRSRLEDAVGSHLVSDVPIGAFLSAGLDSSTVVFRAAPRFAGILPTFTVAYGDGNLDDIRYARVAAKAFRTEHREELLNIGDRSPEDPVWLFRKFDRPDLPLVQRLLYLDIHTYLPDNNPDAGGPLDHGGGARGPCAAARPASRRIRLLASTRANRAPRRDQDRLSRSHPPVASRGDFEAPQVRLLSSVQALGRRGQPRDRLRDPRKRRPRRRRSASPARSPLARGGGTQR